MLPLSAAAFLCGIALHDLIVIRIGNDHAAGITLKQK